MSVTPSTTPDAAAPDTPPSDATPEVGSDTTGSDTAGSGSAGDANGLGLPGFGGESEPGADPASTWFSDPTWFDEIEDTTWITELGTTVSGDPLAFALQVAADAGIASVLFLMLYFIVSRWSRSSLRTIEQRELWDEERKEAERIRTVLLRRYFETAAAGLGVALFLGLFAFRYNVPILRGVAVAVRDWLADGGIGRVLSIVVVGLIIWTLLRVVRKTARALTPTEGQRFERQVARAATIRSVVESAARIVLVTLFILFVLGQLGTNITALLAGVSILGLAVSFGAQSLVKDVITGFFILVEDQFGVGDVVTIAGLTGLVEKINLRITTLRDLEGRVHVIPNGQVDKVTVMSKEWSRSVIDIEVAYRTDLDNALHVIRDEADDFADALGWSWRVMGPPEVLGVEALGASGIIIRILFKTLPKEQWGVGREFRKRIKARLDREGIEIPFPHTTMYWGEGQMPGRREARMLGGVQIERESVGTD